MAIKNLKKITLYGSEKEKVSVLKMLQDKGCVHLIPLRKMQNEIQLGAPIADVNEALTWLERCPRNRRQVRDKKIANLDQVVKKVLENKQEIRDLSDKQDRLRERIKSVRPWGQFVFPDLNDLAGRKLWFYVIKNSQMHKIDAEKITWVLIHKDYKYSYVIVISKTEPEAHLIPAKRSRIGKYSLSHLEALLEQSEHELCDLNAERESLTRWTYLLRQKLVASEDQLALEKAFSETLDNEDFFLIQGWLPEDKVEDFRKMAIQNKVAVLFEDPQITDKPPVKLENSEKTRGGSETMLFFKTPSYHSWDPGNSVFFAFSLFFAMIMSDAMYSALFGLIILFFHRKLSDTPVKRGVRNMGYFMSFIGILWGIIVGSYFGVEPNPKSFWGHLQLLSINNYNTMMQISVCVGIAHLIYANLMHAWVHRNRLYALAHLGWSIVLFGAATAWLGSVKRLPDYWFHFLGPVIIGVGFLLVFLFTSTRPVKNIIDFFLRIVDGIKAIYEVTGAFGDVLSYIRLFALGLSGASLALTFNTTAKQILSSMPVVGVLLAGLVLLIGHGLNFGLCLVSCVVHGVRLNVIEFFKWGLPDEEGVAFKSFSKQED